MRGSRKCLLSRISANIRSSDEMTMTSAPMATVERTVLSRVGHPTIRIYLERS
jgi:hypothetical protein